MNQILCRISYCVYVIFLSSFGEYGEKTNAKFAIKHWNISAEEGGGVTPPPFCLWVRDVDRIRITKVYAGCPGWLSGGHKSTPVKQTCTFPASLQLPTYNWISA
jgi:hypothetical protein